MPQPIAYNTGSQTSGSLKLNGIEYAISSSIVSGSNGQKWFTSVNPGNGIVLVTNSFTQSYATYQNSTPLFYTASALTAAAITGAINGLPDRFGLSQFTDTASAFAWVANSGKYFMMNYEYPQIVTDGLVLLNDAKFLASYPTTQSTWYNLSGNNASSSLFNGPIFNSQGYLDFDGTDDYGLVGGVGLSTTAYTKIAWFKPDTATNNIISGGGDGQHAFWMAGTSNNLQAGHNGAWNTVSYIPGNMTGSWWCGAVTFNTSTGWVLYLNGNIVDTDSNTTTFTGGNAIRIAAYNNASNLFNGKISQVQVYNRVLSASEILQNYYGGPIVTNGLVFAVDASNLVSYESGSTTTYSLTGSLSGSLINGTGFSNVNGGSWVFDGVDDYITFGTSTLITTDFTVENWFSVNDALKEHFLINIGYNSLSSLLLTIDTFGNGTFGAAAYYRDAAGTVVNYGMGSGITEKIHHIVLTRSGATNIAYINGITTNTFSNSTTLASNLNLQLGWAIPRNKSSAYLQGNIFNSRIYNRALSAQEVSQNFNAQRSRFGI